MAAHRRKKAVATRGRRRRGKVGRPVGFKCSPATRAKMSRSAKRRWRGSHGKKSATSAVRHGVRRTTHRRRRA